MDNSLCVSESIEGGSGMPFQFDNIVLAPIVDVTLFAMVERDAAKVCSLIQIKCAGCCLTDARCIRQHCIEYWLEFAWRTADDLEHIGSGRLLLQRLA
jgi:hypothetical protein